MTNVHIRGWGKYLPQQILSNDDIGNLIGTSAEWISPRTGIVERRIAAKDETVAKMSVKAAQDALCLAQANPNDVDLIIVATITPDRVVPATACFVQDVLGCRAAAFDLSAGCSGFIYALSVATKMIEGQLARNALVIGAEAHSHILDWTDFNTCPLLGDGAGAFYLEASPAPGGLLAFELGADGSGGKFLTGPTVGGGYIPAIAPDLSEKYLTMNGKAVYRFATRIMGSITEIALCKAGLILDDLSLLIPHQANLRIIEAAASHLKLPMEKVYVNLDRYGNTSSASIPIACCEAITEERLASGDLVAMVGFGAGYTWGAAIARWP
ncbi:MAG TPA: beta-ketoacyl-ACP synthase III [Ktedonobacteraceae bacterium]|nr:beta-ketoacyl-ACP synthase III [Ktedonobacteraceae bacterium]